ncbi:histidine phosphotransferase family protein [Pseudooceanicola sp. C21-150M6]|uniref:histidine phosphotransferase family protein n=1 Tax=Pseudooceanicola sp. C21-150M6 TaxID=3434355 RepID=UPI003D7F7BC6
MQNTTRYLATLLGSRICHDLISPVGAIQNGLELLQMEGRSGPEMQLIQDAVDNATARIRFMRIAFGHAGAERLSAKEIVSILESLSQSAQVRFKWGTAESCSRPSLQIIFLGFLCMEAAMPRGGEVVADRTETGWTLRGPADLSRPGPALWDLLRQGSAGGEAAPSHVQFLLLASALCEQGKRAQIDSTGAITVMELPA